MRLAGKKRRGLHRFVDAESWTIMKGVGTHGKAREHFRLLRQAQQILRANR